MLEYDKNDQTVRSDLEINHILKRKSINKKIQILSIAISKLYPHIEHTAQDYREMCYNSALEQDHSKLYKNVASEASIVELQSVLYHLYNIFMSEENIEPIKMKSDLVSNKIPFKMYGNMGTSRESIFHINMFSIRSKPH